MTNAQKWISLFLVLFILLLVLAKMTSDKSGFETSTISATESAESTSAISAESILANNRCYICHGQDLNGTGRAPSLLMVAKNWNKGNLISYLQNPQAFMNNERMLVLQERYSGKMPAQENLSEEELNILAEYLLNRE